MPGTIGRQFVASRTADGDNCRVSPPRDRLKKQRGKQPYDKELKTMAAPHLFGGYWNHFDWNRAIADGNKAAGLPYSGQYDFVETVMYWKVNHMVAPKQAAFRCTSCHRDKGGILNWKALGYKGDPARTE